MDTNLDVTMTLPMDDYLAILKEIERLRKMLKELHSLVWGECPSLLNEDSGGDADLDLEIRSALQQKESE